MYLSRCLHRSIYISLMRGAILHRLDCLSRPTEAYRLCVSWSTQNCVPGRKKKRRTFAAATRLPVVFSGLRRALQGSAGHRRLCSVNVSPKDRLRLQAGDGSRLLSLWSLWSLWSPCQSLRDGASQELTEMIHGPWCTPAMASQIEDDNRRDDQDDDQDDDHWGSGGRHLFLRTWSHAELFESVKHREAK